jgi:hypothetical protein
MLKTKQVGIYTVSEAGMLQAVRRVGMLKQLETNPPDSDDERQALQMWAVVAGCTIPIISRDEFLQIPETELDVLVQAVQEMNPHWFGMEPEQAKKKTSKRQPKSTSE